MGRSYQAWIEQLATFCAALFGGAIVTAEITIGALAIAMAVGLVMAVVSSSRIRSLRFFVIMYVEVFRSVPALTQLFIIYFGLAQIGIRLQSLPAAIVGLGLAGGASLTEVFRAGFQALHHGQREAALAVGMTPIMTVRYIILPQAWRIVLPPLGNYSISLLKETSVASAIAAPEIMFFARQLVTKTFETPLIYSMTALFYLAMSIPLGRLVARLERKERSWR
jgi:His/Glu/Gln/Arg/opine family amino acid ABC transporter permease subunit